MNTINIPLTSDEIDTLLDALGLAEDGIVCLDMDDAIRNKLIAARERVNNV